MCFVGQDFGVEIQLINTFCSNQLHLSKLNGVLGSETSDLSSDHLIFSCPFCTKMCDEKAEVVIHVDTFDGKEDPSAMILLSVMRKLKTITTTTTSLMKLISKSGRFCQVFI